MFMSSKANCGAIGEGSRRIDAEGNLTNVNSAPPCDAVSLVSLSMPSAYFFCPSEKYGRSMGAPSANVVMKCGVRSSAAREIAAAKASVQRMQMQRFIFKNGSTGRG